MKIKVEKVESEDNHVAMVELQEETDDIKANRVKEEVNEDLADNGLEKKSDSNSFNVNEARFKIEKVESEDYYGTMVEIQEETEDIKDNFFKEEVNKDLTNNELEKTSDKNSFNANEARFKIEKVESEDYYGTMVEIQEDTEDIKDNFFKEEVNEDLTNNELEKTSDKNSFNDNRTRNESNKTTHGCYFESRIETDNNIERATKYYNEDIIKRRVFQCDLCQKICKTKKQITVHILKSHKNSTVKHCPQKLNIIHCNKFNKTETNINRPYKCYVCFKHFSRRFHLSQHVRVHTKEKPYKCYVCFKSFSRNSNLTLHNRVHTGEKPYKCKVCPKSFSNKSNLTNHERVHTDTMPYKCHMCPKSFYYNTSLKKHYGKHTEEKPFKCNLCSKSFCRKSWLTQHERVHTSEKPYKCHVCPKSFSRSLDLTRHDRVHTGIKPFKCVVCLKSFTQKGNLEKHKNTVHN